MLGFFIDRKYFAAVLVVVLLLAIAGLITGISTGVFETNNREVLREKREAVVSVSP